MIADPRTLAARAEHLVSLHQPEQGGVYAGYAAEKFVKTMAELCELVRSSTLPMWDAWQTTKPPCTTCGGEGMVDGGNCWHDKICPACVDHPGVQPFTEWVAGVIAVWTKANPVGCCADCHHMSHSACLVCGVSDAECMAIIWPERSGIR